MKWALKKIVFQQSTIGINYYMYIQSVVIKRLMYNYNI